MSKDIYDVIVVGGGASGLMAAGRAAEIGARVLILEKNSKMGEKLKITGGGRCNITNAEYDVHALLAHYGPAGKFLFSIFSRFGIAETFSFFESRGLPLVIEERKRAFPKSQKATDVYDVLERYVRGGGVIVKTSSAVTRVNCDDILSSQNERDAEEGEGQTCKKSGKAGSFPSHAAQRNIMEDRSFLPQAAHRTRKLARQATALAGFEN